MSDEPIGEGAMTLDWLLACHPWLRECLRPDVAAQHPERAGVVADPTNDFITDWPHWNRVIQKHKRRSYIGLGISLFAFLFAVANLYLIVTTRVCS